MDAVPLLIFTKSEAKNFSLMANIFSKNTYPASNVPLSSTLSALNGIENYYYHIEFRMDSMHIHLGFI